MGSKKTRSKKIKKANASIDAEDGGGSVDLSPIMSVDDDEFSDKHDSDAENNAAQPPQKAKEHMKQLQRLEEKDPEFYQFLKEYDKELLEFNDEGIDEDDVTDVDELEPQVEELEPQVTTEKVKKESAKVITTAMVDSWCNSIHEKVSLGAVRSLLRAYRTACHYGDDGEGEPSEKFRIMSNSVFNKIMLFVLSEMDGILRELLKLPRSGGKKETIINLMGTKGWKTYGNLVKSYVGNSLHLLNQMTDSQMISFTLRRLRYSAVFLAAFPSILRKYVKVTLHFWGTGGGALPVVSFLFLRDLCIRIGSDCLESCLKGIYKAYVSNCQYVNASKLQHIQFLGNCVIELYGVDLPNAYQHAFVFIRQMAMILRDAVAMKTKEAFGKVYEWKFMNCLELWTGMICAYSSEADLQPLAYPLTQIIFGVARLNPTVRFFPLRLRCTETLNRLAAATGTYIPVSLLLLDMLEMKELNRPPTAGVGKAVDLRTTLKIHKETLKTRAFQEACIFSVVEQLAEHLAQWSYSVAFFELSFIPLARLRSFLKSTKVERFRREMKQLIRQVEASSEFTNKRRMDITFAPNDSAVASFLKAEKESKASPLSQYVATLRARAQERNDSMVESSVLVGAESSMFSSKVSKVEENEIETDNVEGTAIFSSSWLPGRDSKNSAKKAKRSKKQSQKQQHDVGPDEDVVEDLVLSSDEGESMSDSPSIEDGGHEMTSSAPSKQGRNKRKLSTSSKKRKWTRAKKAARKNTN
ncbi:nucleolar complex protein 2 [Cinnamomum micranthum f. kanehirae]|uniref:Nucleolar complex protein 2 n=1 Tax=Cinnamomum micranthum f. kanehirae TaxID=337451 RepID=A0A443PPE8_9MAGN|nr:nucleolar complex protein 2 [Cinnamomum micranthum f. kanehirae]